MHSPIIYLISQDTAYEHSLKGYLPSENELDEEILFDYIDESDWLVANTLERDNWHRKHWNEDLEFIFEDNPYLNYSKEDMKISITHENMNNWNKRLHLLGKKYNEVLERNVLNENYTESVSHRDFDEYQEYMDMIGSEYGGIRFVCYSDSSFREELYLDEIVSLKELIENAKYYCKNEDVEKVEYQICKNIIGDYHF